MRVAAFPRTTKMLFARGLLEETADPEEGRQALRMTAAGLRAIGIPPPYRSVRLIGWRPHLAAAPGPKRPMHVLGDLSAATV